MASIIDAGGAIISDSGRRLEVVALNVANSTTPGYKSVTPFTALVADEDSALETAFPYRLQTNFASGEIRRTGNALDLAIEGSGFFVFRGGSGLVYGRSGQLHLDADGRIVNASGMALQGGSGDIVLRNESAQVLADGTVLDGEEPVARIDVVRFIDESKVDRVGAHFRADPSNVEPISSVRVAQGELEASNVSMVQQMLTMMQLQRSSETGRQLVQQYDDLMGRVISAFGQ